VVVVDPAVVHPDLERAPELTLGPGEELDRRRIKMEQFCSLPDLVLCNLERVI
jgi:hypothetical protein